MILGTENPRTLAAKDDLGVLYSTHGKYRQAERVYRQTAISYQRTLGLKHFNTLYAHLNVIAHFTTKVTCSVPTRSCNVYATLSLDFLTGITACVALKLPLGENAI